MLMIPYFIFMVMILFGITIFIHELGHFLVARKLGMQADVFSIGFGHAIWKREHNGVIYKIGWIPFGGYVALPQMEPGGGKTTDEEGNEIRLPRVEPWKKILVAAAGAAGNILLAFVLAIVISYTGKPSALQETSRFIGFVETNSAAYASGLRMGQEIVEMNGVEVDTWQDVIIQQVLANEVEIIVQDGDGVATIRLPTEADGLGIGIRGVPGLKGPAYCMVGGLIPDSSAEQAGVKPLDIVVSCNGIAVWSPSQLKAIVQSFPDQDVPLVVNRGGKHIDLTVTPKYFPEEEEVLIGIQFSRFALSKEILVYPTPMEQIKDHAGLIFTTLRALVTPKTSRNAAKAIGGPPMIFEYLYMMLAYSLILALSFTCLLNVNLAIINLMPLPVLDGGHIVFSLVEAVTRRPMNERFASAVTAVFAVLLISAMLFLSARDIDRMIDSRRALNETLDAGSPSPAETPAETPAE